MPRTKMPQKKSSIKRKMGSHSISQFSASSESIASSGFNETDDLTLLLSREYESPEHFQQEFEAYYNNKIEMRRKGYEAANKYVTKMFKDIVEALPESFLNLTITSHFDKNLLGDQNIAPDTTVPKVRQSRVRKPDPPTIEFKKPKTPRFERSSSRKRSTSAPPVPHLPPPNDSFKTPLMSTRKQLQAVGTITPKVYSNTPVSVMRRPQHGEVAFSTSGSPLLLGAVSREDIPTVSVPLQDGRVFSIIPDPEAPPADYFEFDEETKRHLKTLQKHLKILAPSNTP